MLLVQLPFPKHVMGNRRSFVSCLIAESGPSAMPISPHASQNRQTFSAVSIEAKQLTFVQYICWSQLMAANIATNSALSMDCTVRCGGPA